ncbi:hypothetical protein ID871_03905 [Streptomyces pratensis]|nr:hypothetical protein [Streptomyces pratensis]
MKLFAKLFGKSAREDSNSAARHRAPRQGQGAEEQGSERPLFRDEVPGGAGASSVDPAVQGA